MNESDNDRDFWTGVAYACVIGILIWIVIFLPNILDWLGIWKSWH